MCIRKIFSTGWCWLGVAVVVFFIDRFAKIWVSQHLIFGESWQILPIFNLTLAYNTGAAFSFLHYASGWQNIFLGGLALIISLIILIWLWRTPVRERLLNIALCLILAGALGNFTDRVLYGYVIDFLDFHLIGWHFAIFNIADSAISVGAMLMLLHWFIYPHCTSRCDF